MKNGAVKKKLLLGKIYGMKSEPTESEGNE